MNSTFLKGKSSSSASNSRIEQANLSPRIRLLTDKYGLTKGSEHQLIRETPSGNHYLITGGKHYVHKHQEGIYWSWVNKGHVPVDERRSGSSTSSNSSTSGGKRKLEETKSEDPLSAKAQQLGTRLLLIAGSDPSEFRDIIQLMDKLEARQAPELEASSSTSASSIGSPRPTINNDLEPADLRQEEVRSSTASEAVSVGVSEPASDTIPHQDPSRQTYTARRNSVFSRLGPERAFGGDDAA